jgi:hypothetical protein
MDQVSLPLIGLRHTKFTNLFKNVTATNRGQDRDNHRIHRKENPSTMTALGRSSTYIQKSQRKRTTRWQSYGKRTLMGSSFS